MENKKNNEANEIDNLLTTLAAKLTKAEYDNACNVIWAMLNGAQFGIENTWSTEFMHNAEDIWFDQQEEEQLNPYKIFEVIQGSKND